MNERLQSEEAGIIRVRSTHDPVDTWKRLESAIHDRKLTVFATINFSDDAGKVGLAMRFTKMLVFGNPRGGTPIMVATPSAALDLPLKALVAEDPDGSVWLSCNDPLYLRRRHDIPAELLANISAVEAILREVAQ